MSKYNMDDLRILSNLSKILPVSASQEIEIEKEEENGKWTSLGIKDTKKDKIILGINNFDKDQISGVYSHWISGAEYCYTIRRLHLNIFILELSNNNSMELSFLQGNYGYTNSIISCIIDGMTKIELSSIADLQILTKDEKQEGKTLVKQFSKNEKKNS